MEQLKQTEPELPSGYEASRQIPETGAITPEQLPWLDGPMDLSIAEVTLQSGDTFYLASAIGGNKDLVQAAEGMTDHQRRITDNMFYSRLPEYVQNGFTQAADSVPDPPTDTPILAFKNKGGQRVYFTTLTVALKGTHDPETGREREVKIITRLAACDKNRQSLVVRHLSGSKSRANKGSK